MKFSKQKIISMLRWSEKHTKTDMLYLTKGSFWLTTAKILSALASFISSIAFANLLPEETYGVFRYFLSILSLLAIPTLSGIDTALTRALSRGHEISTKKVLTAKIYWGILGGIASILLGGYYYYMGNDTLALIFLCAAIFIPVMDPFHIYTAVLNGTKRFKILARDEVATRMCTALLLVFTLFFTQNIFFIIGVYLVSTTFFRYIFLKSVSIPFRGTDDTETKEVISYGKHLSFMNVLGQVSVQIDKILLFHYVGGAALAGYYLALIPFKQVQTFLGSITTLALPKFSGNSMGEIRRSLPTKIIKMYIIIIPIIGLYVVSAPYIFAFVYPQYLSSVLISQLLMFQLLFFPISLFSTALTAQAVKNKLYVNSSVYAIIRISLLLILVPLYGVYGVVASIFTTSVLSSSLLIFLFFKK